MSELVVLDPAAVAGTRTELDITKFIAEAGPDWGEAEVEAYMTSQDIGAIPIDYTTPNRQIRIPLNLLDHAGRTFDEVRSALQARVGLWQREGGWIGRTLDVGTASERTVYADVVRASLRLGGSTAAAMFAVDTDAELQLEVLPDWYEDWVALDAMSGTGEIVGVLREGGSTATIRGDFPRGNRCRIVVTDTSGNDQRGLIAAFRGRHYDPSPTAALSYEAEALVALDTATAVTLAGASFSTVVQHSNLATSWTPVVGGATVAAPPAVRGVGTVASGVGAISPALPTGTTVNDVLLMFLETANEGVAPPSGWLHVTGSPVAMATGTATRLTVLWKRAAVGEAAPTVADPGDHIVGFIIAVSGCAASGNPWDVAATGTEATSDTSVSIPGATTTVPNCLVLAAFATGTDITSTANVSGWTNADLTSVTERFDTWVIDGNGGGLGLASGVRAVAGAYGATTATLASAAEKAMMTIALKPVQPMTHAGTYRVLARLYSASGQTVATRFIYDVGDLVYPTENLRWTFPGASQFYLADLGEVRLRPASAGAHRWSWQIQALGAAGGESVAVDKVWFVPVDEFMASMAVPLSLTLGWSTYAARDEFNQVAGTLNGRALPVGGTWAESGAAATGFALSGTPNFNVTRTAVSDTFSTVWADGKIATASSTSAMDMQAVAVDVTASLLMPAAAVMVQGAVARYVDTNNFLLAALYWFGSGSQYFAVAQRQAGTNAWLGSAVLSTLIAGQTNRISLVAYDSGEWYATLGSITLAGRSASLATGRPLARGAAGIVDVYGSATACTRTYDNFAAWEPDRDAVIFGGQAMSIATDSGPVRSDPSGTAYSGVTPVGNLPRVPTDSTVELLVKGSRGDMGVLPDPGSDPATAQLSYSPCWLNIPGE